jgi:hypothetical protein
MAGPNPSQLYQPPANKDVSTKVEQSPLLEAVTKQRLVKT